MHLQPISSPIRKIKAVLCSLSIQMSLRLLACASGCACGAPVKASHSQPSHAPSCKRKYFDRGTLISPAACEDNGGVQERACTAGAAAGGALSLSQLLLLLGTQSAAAAEGLSDAATAATAATGAPGTPVAVTAVAAAAASSGSGYVPSPYEPGWEVWVGFVAGVVPFIIATVEFSKRVIIQRRCPNCSGTGLVLRGKPQRYVKCKECGGMLPWLGWRYFFFSTATPGNGGPLLQPRGQTSVFYSVPPPPAAKQQGQQQQPKEQPEEQA